MKKRKKDEGASLDSLLDTMTTVVGIMIVILIVVQLGADSAVKEYVEQAKKEDPIKLEEDRMKHLLKQKTELLDEKKKLQMSMAAKNKQDQKLVEEIAALEKKLTQVESTMPKSQANPATLQAQKKKVEDNKKTIEVKLKKIKGLLTKSPKPSTKSLSKDVNLPDPKPAPPKAKPFRFLCRGGGIFPVDDFALMNRVKSLISQSGLKPNKDKEYDGAKLVSLVNGKKIGNPFFTIKSRADSDKVIRFTIERKSNAGEEEGGLVKPGSKYLKALNGLKPTSHYLLFEVFPDSFGTYLAARDLANARKFPAGWKPVNRGPDWWSFDWGYRVIGRKAFLASRPPAPKPTGKPAPPKKPANVLD